MSRVDSAKSEVANALKRVQVIAAEALKDNDYSGLAGVAAIAGQLEAVLSETKTAPASPNVIAEIATRKRPQKRKAKPKRKATREPAKEPEFYRGENEIIKVGRSKSGDGTYEHRASYDVASRLIRELSKTQSPEVLIRMDDLMPRLGKIKGSVVPSYQSYLCLAWMRSEGLVIQHGRRGYTVPDPANLKHLVQKRFQALKQR